MERQDMNSRESNPHPNLIYTTLGRTRQDDDRDGHGILSVLARVRGGQALGMNLPAIDPRPRVCASAQPQSVVPM